MCYPKPGPRCSNHARKAFLKAKGEYLALDPAQTDTKTKEDAYERLMVAQDEYYMTPKGQEYLDRQIKETYSPTQLEKLKLEKELALERRKSALADYKGTKNYEDHEATDSVRLKDNLKRGVIFGNTSGQIFQITTVRDGKVHFKSIDTPYPKRFGVRVDRLDEPQYVNRYTVIQGADALAQKRAGQRASAPKFTPAQAESLFRDALLAGQEAGRAKSPAPMVVEQHKNPLDDDSRVVKTYRVDEGVCGFAWVTVRPGNSSFARWVKKEGLGEAGYGGGVEIWVRDHNQSYERKVAHARAMVEVLRKQGVEASVGSRLD